MNDTKECRYLMKTNFTLKKEYGNIWVDWMVKKLNELDIVESAAVTESIILWGCTDVDLDIIILYPRDAEGILTTIRDYPFTKDVFAVSIEPMTERK